MKLTKRNIWLGVGLLLLSLALFLILRSQQLSRLDTRPAINFADPNVIAISEGTEGGVHSLEIGVGYVGPERAELSIYDMGRPEQGVQGESVVVGSSVSLDSYFLIVLDIDGAERTVVLEVLPDDS